MHTITTKATLFLRKLWLTDAPLTAVGLLMFALLAATLIALAVDPRQIGGAPAWMKPAKFAASIGIYTLTLAWVFSYLPEWVKTRRVVSWVTVLTLMIEIILIDLQAWRGTTSHFNVGTTADMVIFNVMGLAILVQTLGAVALAVALWRQRFLDAAMGWALRLGITITLMGATLGAAMVQPTQTQLEEARAGKRITISGAHTVGAPDGGPGLPGTGWSRDHGDLRVAHFVGLHALQILPLLSFVVSRRERHEARRVQLTLAASASYIALFAVLVWQALRGQSVVNPDISTLIALAGWALLTAASFAMLLYRPNSNRARSAAY